MSGGVVAIVVAAGNSRRMGFDKLFAPLAGKPVLAHTLEAFEQCPEVGSTFVVAPEANHARIQSLVASEGFAKVSKIVGGGAERQDSVWEGICAAGDDYEIVAVHDGARPLVSPETIARCIVLARSQGAASCARPVTDTVKRAGEGGIVEESVDREGLWAMETPQVFKADLLKSAYEMVRRTRKKVTDEVSAVQQMGEPVRLIDSSGVNLKITFPGDLVLAEAVLGHF